MTTEVRLWGRTIGAVSSVEGQDFAVFQYDPEFVRSGIDVSPVVMPLREEVYTFPALALNTFHGLPGLLADSLPDKFGNALIDAWLATQGRPAGDLNPLERLCYTGSRGMGALEFHPMRGPRPNRDHRLEIDALVRLASEVLSHRAGIGGRFNSGAKAAVLGDILQVGTSAGGARAKAVIAWNRTTDEVRSGQIEAGDGFEHWLIKFDGVRGNRDKELADPTGYGRTEYAYHLMARAAGIEMSECRLMEESGRHHFMTRRFDRTPAGRKLHMQSLGGLAHYDFNQAGAHSYEQAIMVMSQLGLPLTSIEEQYRRMVFNIVARNQDDHVKNIAFLMDRDGSWSLAPAFDLTYSYSPSGAWTATHQMTMNGKRDGFLVEDFKACARTALLRQGRARTIVEEVHHAVARWPEFASAAGVPIDWQERIRQAHRLPL